MNMIKETFFGSLEPLLIRNGEVVTELATFTSNGKSHKHRKYETCYILSGKGFIRTDPSKDSVSDYTCFPGRIITIPPKIGHWMEVAEGETMEIMLVYSDCMP